MLTACPYCQTTFRITAEQLVQRSGKVRCGQCQQIFNAHFHLSQPLTVPIAKETHATTGTGVAAKEVETAPVLLPSLERSSAVEPELVGDLSGVLPPELLAEKAEGITGRPPEVEILTARAEGIPLENQAPSGIAPSQHFRWKAERKMPKALQMTFYGLNGFLFLLLLAQGAYWMKDAFVQVFPESTVFWAGLCKAVEQDRCVMGFVGDVSKVSIEATELQQSSVQAGPMLLTATLRNWGDRSAPYPYLELTLLDLDEQPKVRMVISPQTYLALQSSQEGGSVVPSLETSLSAGGERVLRLPFKSELPGIVGYRLAHFAP